MTVQAAPAGRLAAFAGSGRTLPALGVALILIGLVALALQLNAVFAAGIAVLVAQGAVYAVCVWLVMARGATIPLWAILAVAVALRIGPLLAPPYLSTDIFRYVWDGRVQGAGINPYLYVPDDPAVAFLRDDSVFPLINRAAYAHTIYPPVAQMVFFLATRLSATVVAMKATFVAFEAVTIWAILRLLDADGRPRALVLVYAWCPLAAWEFAGSGHVDAVMAAFVVLAVLARRREAHGLAGVALGLAVLTKFFPLVLVPALWRRWDWRLPVAMVVTIVLGYLVYIKAGWGVFGFMTGYVSEEGIDDGSGFWLLDTLSDLTDLDIPSIVYLVFAGVVMAALALFTMFRMPERKRLIVGSLALSFAGMLALSPNYPWYFVWVLPMACLTAPAWPLVWVVATGPLLYFADWNDDEGIWTPNYVYGGAYLILIATLIAWWFVWRRGRPAVPPPSPALRAEEG